MAAPSIVASVNAATSTQITTTAPSGSGGLLVFIAAHDTGSTEPFGIPNDFGSGTITDQTGHLISNYTAMPAAANVLQVWTKPAGGSEPASYVLDIQDAASGGAGLSRSTIFAVCRVTHPDGTPTVSAVATDVNDAGSANEPVNPSVTTTAADNLVAYIVGWDEGKTLSAGGSPASTTELFHSDQTLHDLLLNYFTQASAGATGTGSWNISSGTRWCAATLAFAPPAVSTVTGTGAATLAITASATGARGAAGTGAASLGITGSGSGTHTAPVTGAGAATLAITGGAAGSHGVAGTASATLAITGAGAGEVVGSVTGTGAATLAITASGTGASGAAGQGSATLAITGSATGNRGAAGQGSATLGLTGSADGGHGVSGTADAELALTGAGVGEVEIELVTGTGSADLIIVGEAVGRYLGWVSTDPTSEDWTGASQTAETWTTATAAANGWAAASPTSETWTPATPTSETWN